MAPWAARGKCKHDENTQCVDDDPGDRARTDKRTLAQRQHDALSAIGRAMLASGQFGKHQGLPATIIVSTTLQDLEAASGYAITGGGTLLPMRDVIRLATHATTIWRCSTNTRRSSVYGPPRESYSWKR